MLVGVRTWKVTVEDDHIVVETMTMDRRRSQIMDTGFHLTGKDDTVTVWSRYFDNLQKEHEKGSWVVRRKKPISTFLDRPDPSRPGEGIPLKPTPNPLRGRFDDLSD